MGKRQATRDESAKEPSFEQSLEDLAGIVESLESGDLGLQDSLGKYEQGVKLLKRCHGLLEKVERRIELLSGFDADGNPVTTPVKDESSLAKQQEQAPQSRGTKTTRKKRKTPVSDTSDDSSAMDDRESLF